MHVPLEVAPPERWERRTHLGHQHSPPCSRGPGRPLRPHIRERARSLVLLRPTVRPADASSGRQALCLLNTPTQMLVGPQSLQALVARAASQSSICRSSRPQSRTQVRSFLKGIPKEGRPRPVSKRERGCPGGEWSSLRKQTCGDPSSFTAIESMCLLSEGASTIQRQTLVARRKSSVSLPTTL